MKMFRVILFFAIMAIVLACGKDDMDNDGRVELFSILANGSALTDGATDLPTDLTITITFSASLNKADFEDALSIRSSASDPSFNISYTNNSSRVILEMDLENDTEYNLEIAGTSIGIQGQRLKDPVSITFFTRENEVITSMPPCTNANDCKRSVMLEGSNGLGAFEFFANYPVYEDNARWEDLTQAVIVVHGLSINPDVYYGYLSNTLEALNLSESTVLVAPFFRTETTGDQADFYWSSSGWREGRESRNPNKISSFEALDAIIEQLADTAHFPVLDQIIVTGQSSGGLFTHTYAAANISETALDGIDFNYLVSESQYFYYPDGQRINENDNELYTPSGCTGYDIWPLGYEVVPPYVAMTEKQQLDEQFVSRNITYVLGNGSGTDNSLNTTDCSATLLGSSRYQRGENMHRYMELKYPGQHNHSKLIVPGVTHNGLAIYQSTEFRTLLTELLQQ